MKSQFEMIFVKRSKGTYEGNDYDNVYLSNGIATAKLKNVSESKFDLLENEKSRVIVTLGFSVNPKDERLEAVELHDIALKK